MKNVCLVLSLILMVPEVLLAQATHPSIGQYRRGKVLFAQRACASCHITDGSVESLGPDLSKPEKPFTRTELLESIRDPSKIIRKGYETSALLLTKGEVVTGRIVERTDEAVTLTIQKNLAAERVTIPVSDIEETAVQNVSAMPKGLIDGLSTSQVDDLLAYLSAVGDPTFKEPVPATIPVKVSGVTHDPVDADSTYYSPEESMKRIHLPAGYRLELVAAEPMIEEPVLCVWDGNSRMYVAEMRTYMQDAEGTDQDLPRSRVSLLEDTDGDGRMDKVTRFVDNMVLPRMILPLDDRIIINETYTQDYYSYRDTDGDGVADEKILLYSGGKDGGNLEHQNSGLTWGLDNWIYTARTGGLRHRFINGKWTSERIYGDNGQWGLAMDDLGRFFLSSAGGEKPAYGFQQLPQYGKLTLPNELERHFETVYPIVKLDDVQGGRGRVHPEKQTLTLFTACGGQSIYRGDQMPEGFNGDYILPEPVGRLVRRAKVTQIDGKTVLSNAYESSEFIASTDKNFRPLWSATGPDGCLYIVDMYRGIIQEGNWTRKGSYLRDRIDEQGFAKNIGRGRIYRVVHESTKRSEQPRLLSKSTTELVTELSHPNGWRRDTAQRLIVLRQDANVIPDLEALAQTGTSALGRVHAIWTLDGLGAVTKPLIEMAMNDADPRVQQTAIRLSESHLAQAPELVEKVAAVGFESDLSVTIQAINSLRYANSDRARQLIADLAGVHPANDIVLVSSQASIRNKEGDGAPTFAEMDPRTLEKMKRGYEAYTLVCIRCHGHDGKGAFASDGLQLAPSLVDSKRLLATSELPVRILLHGLMGPIEGKTYPGLMESMKREDDEWIASALTYVRNSFGNSAGPVTPENVARIRQETSTRTQPYKVEELAEFMPVPNDVVSKWTFSASLNSTRARNAVDGKQDTRFDMGKPQEPGQWFQFDMGIPYELTELLLDTRISRNDFPRSYIVRFSDDGEFWSEPVLTGKGTSALTSLRFAPGATTRFLRITQTGKADSNFWSIHELSIFGRPCPSPAVIPVEAN
ncbi:MAG TPA: PVC-type heme-binding CxxCH protein [Planctomicrobium sp.]|nr:PVC-type heme-binding CxxCH protein [Planctomicrobium sp.]